MITCLFVGVAFMIAYTTSGKFFVLFLAILSFLLAAMCHGALRNKVDKLEGFFKQQVDRSNMTWDILQKMMVYKDVEGDDLK